MDMHRRNTDEIDAQMAHQKDRAQAELQVTARIKLFRYVT